MQRAVDGSHLLPLPTGDVVFFQQLCYGNYIGFKECSRSKCVLNNTTIDLFA